MKTKSRIESILKARSLDFSITGFKPFHLADLGIDSIENFQLPSNVRLGHLTEKVVSELIRRSPNYRLIDENIQVIVDGKTIGEMDFLIEENATGRLIHMELAYKFYLFDPSLSAKPVNCWIGPNRKDSLREKLVKLRTKQFPLLHHEAAQLKLDFPKKQEVSQALCLLASLFIPYGCDESFGPEYKDSIKGHYLDLETFLGSDHSGKTYFLPTKKEWGIDPSDNEVWNDFDELKEHVAERIQEKQAPLCWEKNDVGYRAFFVVWW